MGKPLLTDDVIRRATLEEEFSDWSGDQDKTQEIHFDRRDLEPFIDQPEGVLSVEVKASTQKSRRLETQKRHLFQSRLNRILAILILLAIALVLAVIYF